MVILDEFKSNELRCKYIGSFVDTTSDYFVKNIEKKTKFSDGECYVGYLWDCLQNPQVISASKANEILKEKSNIFIMWDIHSYERVFIPNYWKYPKTRILSTDKWGDSLKVELPEDIYLFDETFRWSVVFTHETDEKGRDYCIYIGEH